MQNESRLPSISHFGELICPICGATEENKEVPGTVNIRGAKVFDEHGAWHHCILEHNCTLNDEEVTIPASVVRGDKGGVWFCKSRKTNKTLVEINGYGMFVLEAEVASEFVSLFEKIPDSAANHEYFCHEHSYKVWEREIAQPLLEAQGYTRIVWLDGERDSFGPLTRYASCFDQNGELHRFIYG